MLSSYNKLEGFISLFVSNWPPPMTMTMDAVLATIVAGRRGLNIEDSKFMESI